MKPFIFILTAMMLVGCATTVKQPATLEVNSTQIQPREDAKERYQARRAKINSLVEAYQDASEQEKPSIKKQLIAEVKNGMKASIAYAKERLEEERANLDRFAAKLKKTEKHFDAVAAHRTENILNGDAERQYRDSQKEWKKLIKNAKEQMQ